MNESTFYHYSESGLDNVYLVGGFTKKDIGGEEHVSIQNVDGLHRAIGMLLVESHKRLSGKEIRFLRTELLLSQNRASNILGVDTQSFARWEKEQSAMNISTEAAFRAFYKESLGCNSNITDMLLKLADLEDEINDYRLLLEESESGWSAAA